MASFFSKLFGLNKGDTEIEKLLSETIEGIIKNGNFNLEYKVELKGDSVYVNFSGEDAKILTDRDGMVLDGFQIFLKRLIQNKKADQQMDLVVDCDGYLEASADELKALAEKLRDMALSKGQATYVRALPPRDRKTVHRHLAEDVRIKSQSIGEGFCKKIKITPISIKNNSQSRQPRQNI